MADRTNETFFLMVWKLDNFNSSVKGFKYYSPNFDINHMQQCSRWQLYITKAGRDDAVLKIRGMALDITSVRFNVDVELSCLDNEGCKVHGKEFRKQKSHLLHENCILELTNSGTLRTLTVQCKFWRFDGVIPLQSQTVFAGTTFTEKCLSFTWPIKDFSSLTSDQRAVINMYRETNTEDMNDQTVDLQLYWDKEGIIFVEFSLESDNLAYIYSTFKACILDSTSQAVDSVIASRVLNDCGYCHRQTASTLQFAFSKPVLTRNKEKYLPGGVLSLRCEIIIYGTPEYIFERSQLGVQNFVASSSTFSETALQYPNFSHQSCGATQEKSSFGNETLKQMFEDKICSDYTLLAGSKSFPVHRAVLCCRSPVFRAMFTTDMKEARSESMQLPNVDANTLNRFILFLYKEELDAGLNWEDASKLYSLSDQYEVTSLSNRCRSLLKCRITNSNACEMLVLADAHHDNTLSSVVTSYIKEHSVDLVNIDEWENFIIENESLANDYLTDLIRSKKRKFQE